MTRHLDLPLPERCLEEPPQVREHLETEPEMLLVLPPALPLQFVEPCDEMLPPGVVLRLQAGIGVRAHHASVPAASVTGARYGPVHVVVWHEAPYAEALYLVTSMELAEEAIYYYGLRFRIETSFSDPPATGGGWKSRGFHLDKSHVSDLERLSRLVMAAALACL